MNYDFIIIGSGFGGSVSALRLTEKGYKVAVVEQGRQVTPSDMEEAAGSMARFLWNPSLKLSGYFSQTVFKHLGIVGGVGVGGGSLVYAAVLLKPKGEFYADPAWNNLGIDWEKELSPHYETASTMLGVTPNPSLDRMDEFLKQTAENMGAGETFGPTPMGVYFGTPEIRVKDPFFNGSGPSRTGCHLCGECLAGCPHGAKNTLDKNYLYLAQKLGAVVLPERKATNIIPLGNGQYQVDIRHPIKKFRKYPPLTAGKIIMAAGALGTMELLFRCRNVTGTLPLISDTLGKIVRTNSEAVVAALSPDPDIDLSKGSAISSDFYPDKHTHITQNRFPRGYTFMKWYLGPLVNHDTPFIRALITFGKILANPLPLVRNWFATNWHKRITVLTVMQNLDNRVSFSYGRSLLFLFLKNRLKSKKVPGKEAPSNLPVANRAAETLGNVINGTPLNILMESMGNLSFTAHILGGCNIGASPETGVINASHEVFNCPGIYVMDGAAVSANVGVNPSLTITAMAERAMSLIPPKNEADPDFFTNSVPAAGQSRIKNLIKNTLKVLVFLSIINLALTGINILQKGGDHDGRSLAEILGKPAAQATAADLEQLSKPEIMQLFYAATVPDFSSMNGEYKAKTLPVGIMAPAADFFTHHFFGPGHWEGKAFFPFNADRGWGYNLFLVNNGNNKTLARTRKMDTWIKKSKIDDNASFHLVYKTYNGGLVSSMHDEIRQINDTLYICMGYMAAGGGAINPAPFILYGKPSPWVGPDKQ